MLFDFVTMIIAGVAAGGAVMALNHLVGRRLPRWAMPVAAGLAMLCFTIWNEYNWVERSIAQYPDTAVVTFRNEKSEFWRPWTFVAPVTTRLAVLDRGPAAGLPADPGPDYRHAVMYLMERWRPSYAVTVLFDCARARRLDGRADGATEAELATADWHKIDREDAALRAACGGGANG